MNRYASRRVSSRLPSNGWTFVRSIRRQTGGDAIWSHRHGPGAATDIPPRVHVDGASVDRVNVGCAIRLRDRGHRGYRRRRIIVELRKRAETMGTGVSADAYDVRVRTLCLALPHRKERRGRINR